MSPYSRFHFEWEKYAINVKAKLKGNDLFEFNVFSVTRSF